MSNFFHFRSSNICTYGRAKMAVILIALFSLVYNIPRFFEVTWGVPTSEVNEIYWCKCPLLLSINCIFLLQKGRKSHGMRGKGVEKSNCCSFYCFYYAHTLLIFW